MDPGTVFILLLLLACPLMMVFMHRGGHGSHASHGGGEGHVHGGSDDASRAGSLDELRRRRAKLDAEIASLERSESETKTPAAV